MAAIIESIDISRPPVDVFAYATDFSHFPEWQGGVVSARAQGDAPLGIGSRALVTRRVGPRKLARTEEITALHPPRSWAVRGGGGPLIATAEGTIEPLADGERQAAPSARPPPGAKAAATKRATVEGDARALIHPRA
jgi:uncharacterized protein YndB with AHSA1/START domain